MNSTPIILCLGLNEFIYFLFLFVVWVEIAGPLTSLFLKGKS